MIIAIVTCKGRLSHLKKTLPIIAKEFEKVVVIDWGCPEESGKWAYEKGAIVYWGPNNGLFHKTMALNVGADIAIQSGATKLCFIDADTLIINSIRYQLEVLEPREIAITGPKSFDHSQLIGFLCCSVGSFLAVNGFDTEFIGWGYEDLDMRLRLICDAGCKPIWIDKTCFASIKHDNATRKQFQPDSLLISSNRNKKLYKTKLRERLADHWSKELQECLPYK